ncbi:hypothetical protein BG015_012046 [Linnemannia schmuckeri]|uniref:Sel1 repeat family protein n=1 Tax=Linnemannia schmuckeri TaxID=64567 RepID=A0A9P5RS78_9FUNG|nr:hypothetical protein BG015_012046 [Linnemannia schmuckeri]
MYMAGKGVPQDHYRALQWLLPSAMGGHPKAQYRVGSMHKTGEGLLPKDYSKAMEWYRKATDQGYEESQVEIGQLYFFGHGVYRDHSIALE